jgi:hypothetical protein
VIGINEHVGEVLISSDHTESLRGKRLRRILRLWKVCRIVLKPDVDSM